MSIKIPQPNDKRIDFQTYRSLVEKVNELDEAFGSKYKADKNRYRYAKITKVTQTTGIKSYEAKEVYYDGDAWSDIVNGLLWSTADSELDDIHTLNTTDDYKINDVICVTMDPHNRTEWIVISNKTTNVSINHSFKIWLDTTNETNKKYAVCEIDPATQTLFPTGNLAGRVYTTNGAAKDIDAVGWTTYSGNLTLYLNFSVAEGDYTITISDSAATISWHTKPATFFIPIGTIYDTVTVQKLTSDVNMVGSLIPAYFGNYKYSECAQLFKHDKGYPPAWMGETKSVEQILRWSVDSELTVIDCPSDAKIHLINGSNSVYDFQSVFDCNGVQI